MILDEKKTEDPRDNLAKSRRWELQQFARFNGITELDIAGLKVSIDDPAVGAILLRRELRARGLTQIPIPSRPLGHMNQPHPQPMYQNGLATAQSQRRAPAERPNGVEIDADADLARQFQAEQARPRRLVEKPKSEINALRDECKRKGIKLARTDRMPDMKRKLAEHG